MLQRYQFHRRAQRAELGIDGRLYWRRQRAPGRVYLDGWNIKVGSKDGVNANKAIADDLVRTTVGRL